jgi:ribosomal protein S18 acetylase RimI-like enzyme
MNVQIRKMTIKDYAAAYALWQNLPGIGLSSADKEDALCAFLAKNPGTCLIAEDAGRLVGTVLGGSDGRRGYLYHLAVHRDYQKRGLGRALTAVCLNALRAQGIEKCHIFVLADNQEGLKFWQNTGWELREDILILSKSLCSGVDQGKC